VYVVDPGSPNKRFYKPSYTGGELFGQPHLQGIKHSTNWQSWTNKTVESGFRLYNRERLYVELEEQTTSGNLKEQSENTVLELVKLGIKCVIILVYFMFLTPNSQDLVRFDL